MSKRIEGVFYEEPGGRLMNADALDVLFALPPASVDLILTDPPYGTGAGDLGSACFVKTMNKPMRNDTGEAWANLIQESLRAAWLLLKPAGCLCYCAMGGGTAEHQQFAQMVLWIAGTLRFKQAVVWDKGFTLTGWHYHRSYEFVLVAQKGPKCVWNGGSKVSNIIRVPKVSANRTHPTEKPVELMEKFIEYHTDPGALVLDPFCGTGATLVAAKKLGRKFIGVEIERGYCEVAARRLKEMRK